MRVALVGTGQMGQAVAEVAEERGHDICARFNSRRPLREAGGPEALGGAEVVIDFSLPAVALENIKQYCAWDCAAVIGTTGWYDHLSEVRNQVQASRAAVLYAPNFSLGVTLLKRALESVAPLLDALPDFDAYIHEVHHVRKADSPSGTALMLADVLVDHLRRKTRVETETQHEQIDGEALHVTAARAGDVYGRHRVGIESPYDELTLAHGAKNRKGFAFGAVRAAEWLPEKQGLFTLDDVLAEWLQTAPAPD